MPPKSNNPFDGDDDEVPRHVRQQRKQQAQLEEQQRQQLLEQKPGQQHAKQPEGAAEEDTLEDLKRKQGEALDSSVGATRRIVALAEEARDSGANTLGMLDDQQQALDRIEDKQNNVDKNLKEGDEQLSMLERMCCGFGPRAPVRTISVDPPSKSKSKKKQPAKAEPMSKTPDSEIVKSTSSRLVEGDSRDLEIDVNLDAVSSILGDLKDQANQMSVTVDNQNEQIDRITNATDKNIAHAKQATKRQQAILNNN